MAGDVHGRGGIHGKGCAFQGACMAEGMCGKGLCMVGVGKCGKGVMHGRGVHGRGHIWQGVCLVGETATASDGTHPTGMYSCFISSTHKAFLDIRHNVHLCHLDTLLYYNNQLCDNAALPQ